jgi:hypothetical protein
VGFCNPLNRNYLNSVQFRGLIAEILILLCNIFFFMSKLVEEGQEWLRFSAIIAKVKIEPQLSKMHLLKSRLLS